MSRQVARGHHERLERHELRKVHVPFQGEDDGGNAVSLPGYGFADVHDFVEQERYVAHIKHRRRRNEPVLQDCPVPGETQFPARRWVVERTFGWLAKRRSLGTRWAKKSQNWLALIQFACAHILMDMAIYG